MDHRTTGVNGDADSTPPNGKTLNSETQPCTVAWCEVGGKAIHATHTRTLGVFSTIACDHWVMLKVVKDGDQDAVIRQISRAPGDDEDRVDNLTPEGARRIANLVAQYGGDDEPDSLAYLLRESNRTLVTLLRTAADMAETGRAS